MLFIVLSFRLAATPQLTLTIDDGKAHYILEVIKHITWPNENDITNFNIVILGHDKYLMNALGMKSDSIIRGKTISIQQFEHLSEIENSIEVFFVSRNKISLIPDINEKHSHSLIISDGRADKQNLMVGLLVEKKNIRLALNRKNLIKHGFKISNGLLEFAGTKADLREELKDKNSTLNEALRDVNNKEIQLSELNESLSKSTFNLQQIKSDLIEQSNLLSEAQTQLNNSQTQLNSLKTNKAAIIIELANKKRELTDHQKLLSNKEIEHKKQQLKLFQLNKNIEQAEERLKQQVNKLRAQSNIIERKDQKITGQRQLLFITIALATILILLKFVILRENKIKKQANEELANLNEQLYELATQDDMTKLFNRRHFLELAQREIIQLQRAKSMGVVLMIDIDHFKNINDNYGHAAGDQAIINVANILKDNLREYDIVGRVGGEEFAMFLPNSETDIALQISERIRVKVADLSTLFQQSSIKLTISIGLTARKEHEGSIDSMLQRADKALYQAKSSGRNKVTLL